MRLLPARSFHSCSEDKISLFSLQLTHRPIRQFLLALPASYVQNSHHVLCSHRALSHSLFSPGWRQWPRWCLCYQPFPSTSALNIAAGEPFKMKPCRSPTSNPSKTPRVAQSVFQEPVRPSWSDPCYLFWPQFMLLSFLLTLFQPQCPPWFFKHSRHAAASGVCRGCSSCPQCSSFRYCPLSFFSSLLKRHPVREAYSTHLN